jgi:hypothetical protein
MTQMAGDERYARRLSEQWASTAYQYDPAGNRPTSLVRDRHNISDNGAGSRGSAATRLYLTVPLNGLSLVVPIVLGCFILFGLSTITAAILQLASSHQNHAIEVRTR